MSHLADNALTTLDTANAELGLVTGEDVTRDRNITRYINVASDLFVRLCGRSFHKQTGIVENVGQPFGSSRLIVGQVAPILSVSSIVLDGETIDASKYFVEDADLGWITKRETTWESTETVRWGINHYSHEEIPNYVVTYDAGYATPHQVEIGDEATRTLPYDIEDAILSYVSFRFSRQGDDTSVKSMTTGDWSITYMDGVQIPATFEQTVNHYKTYTTL